VKIRHGYALTSNDEAIGLLYICPIQIRGAYSSQRLADRLKLATVTEPLQHPRFAGAALDSANSFCL
jgi:hypothetical protein